MHYIKVLATDSTNKELKRRLTKNPRISNTSLLAQKQIEGRGQQGANWKTENFKNLTFSILINNLTINAIENFKLNALVSLSIRKYLQQETGHDNFMIKWPNDILADQKKLCGILIENTIKSHQITQSIIGIGINVNQTDFEGLPKATSLKNLTGKTYDITTLWEGLSELIEQEIQHHQDTPLPEIIRQYEARLFMINRSAYFQLPSGETVSGTIRGVSKIGKLLLETDAEIKEFQLKEIKLIY